MSAEDPISNQAAPRHPWRSTPFEQIIALIREIISDWGRTLRFALLASVPIISVTAAVYACAQLAADPSQWWKPVVYAVGVYIGVRILRRVRRRIGKLSRGRR